jgi:hypothetical protein
MAKRKKSLRRRARAVGRAIWDDPLILAALAFVLGAWLTGNARDEEAKRRLPTYRV